MTFRESCGTVPGAVAHQEAGESLCGWCAMGERVALLAAGLASPGFYPPVTPQQAEMNRALLASELRAYEIGHGHHMHGKRSAA